MKYTVIPVEKRQKQQTVPKEKIIFPLKKNGDIFQIKMDKYIYFIYVSPVMIHGQGSFGSGKGGGTDGTAIEK